MNYRHRQIRRKLADAEQKIEEMEIELDELNTLFDFQHKRTVEADRLFKQAHGWDEKRYPDLGTLIEWLMSFHPEKQNCDVAPMKWEKEKAIGLGVVAWKSGEWPELFLSVRKKSGRTTYWEGWDVDDYDQDGILNFRAAVWIGGKEFFYRLYTRPDNARRGCERFLRQLKKNVDKMLEGEI